MTVTPRPTLSWSTSATRRLITPSASSFWIRFQHGVDDKPTRCPISATEREASCCRTPSILRSMPSMRRPREIVLLATTYGRNRHGVEMKIAASVEPCEVCFLTGHDRARRFLCPLGAPSETHRPERQSSPGIKLNFDRPSCVLSSRLIAARKADRAPWRLVVSRIAEEADQIRNVDQRAHRGNSVRGSACVQFAESYTRSGKKRWCLSLKFSRLDRPVDSPATSCMLSAKQDQDTMPRGPKGEKRPADVIGNAVHVMRIATGEIEDDLPTPEIRRQRSGRRRLR